MSARHHLMALRGGRAAVAAAILALAGVSRLGGDGWTLSRIAVVPDLTNEMGTVTQDLGSNSVEITTSGTALGPGFDQMLFYHVPLGPTGSITARVDAPAAASGASAKAGLMIRASADPTAPHAAQFAVSAASPSAFSGHGYLSRADADSDWRVEPWVGGGTPHWVRLVRSYGLVEGYTSTDGSNWTLGGSAQVDLPGTALAGLFAANDGKGDETFTFEAMDATGAAFTDADGDGMDDFWEWRIFGTLGRSTAPSVTWLSPTNGEAIAIGAPVYLAVSMTDRELVSAVDFFADGTNVGQDATYPYAVPWSNSVVGAHSLWAHAAFGQGATTASAPVSVTIFDPDPDGDGSPDAWELEWFGSTTNPDAVASADPDGDGMTNGFERLELTSPLDYFNGALPEMEIVGGDMQGAGTNAFLAEVLAVRLSRPSGLVYSNAPVTFSAPAGGLAPTNAGQTFLSLDVRADANGIARAWYRTPSVASTNAITATASNATDGVSVALTAFAGAGKPTLSLLAPDNLASEPGLNRGLFQVVRTGNPWISVTAQLGVSGTASNGLDYDSLPTNLLLSAGLLTGAIEVVVRDDTDSEAPETVVLRLLTNSAYSVGSPASNTVTVADNDSGGGTAAIGAGDGFSAAIMYDGTIWTWGSDADGRLGNGDDFGSTNRPAQIQGQGLVGFQQISCGTAHVLALASNGTVKAWGDGGSGKLGVGGPGDEQSPNDVDNLTGVIAVSAGDDHSMALTNGGKLFCWGDNQQGQVGVGTDEDNYEQAQLTTLTSGVIRLSAGRRNSYAIQTGSLKGCGDNDRGQLARPDQGAGSFGETNRFFTVLGGVDDVASGREFVLARIGDKVWSWGENQDWQLGAESPTYRTTAAQVAGTSNVIAVAAGRNHSMVLRSDGSVWCWGLGDGGRLGDGNGGSHRRATPNQATAAGFSNVIAIAAGRDHSMALDKQGWIWVWGTNGNGQLGLGSGVAATNRPTRVETLNLLSYPPLVEITSPADGLSLTNAAGRLALAASAEDPDGSVARVDFYEGTNLIGSDASAPFTATWTNLPVGTWTFNAKATDNKGVSATSAPVTVTISSDDDGMGDAWEQTWFGNLGQDPDGDADGDGLTNVDEYAHGTAPTQPDTDLDGLFDSWEVANGFSALIPNTTDGDPNNDPGADPDGDGLTNSQEADHGTTANNPDSDNDGVSDSAEVAQGSNPNDPNDSQPPPSGTVAVNITFGDDSGSHSEKYRVRLVPLEGDSSSNSQRYRTNRQYGLPQTDTFRLPRGSKYRVDLQHVATDPEHEGPPKPDYDYVFEVDTSQGCIVLEDPHGISGHHYESDSFFASGKTATLYVPLFEWVTPKESPASSADDSGDGQNEFTYSTASPGVLTIDLKVLAKPSGVAGVTGHDGRTFSDRCVFTLPTLGGSAAAWDGANPGGKSQAVGEHLIAKATYTTLPATNSDFGLKQAQFECDSDTSVVPKGPFEVFFPKEITNHPGTGAGTTPNWHHYWAGTAVTGYDISSGTYSYANGSAGDYAQYNGNPGNPHYTIHGPASAGHEQYSAAGLNVDRKGIDTLACTLVHEKTHRQVDQNWLSGGIWNGKLDSDGDELPDEWEDANATLGFDKNNRFSFSGFPYGDDEEVYCERAALGTTGNSAQDWANPGKQSKTAF